MKYLDETQLKTNLVDEQGKPYVNQIATSYVNGIFYNILTDSNGQVALNIQLPPEKYIITANFNGANIINKITKELNKTPYIFFNNPTNSLLI